MSVNIRIESIFDGFHLVIKKSWIVLSTREALRTSHTLNNPTVFHTLFKGHFKNFMQIYVTGFKSVKKAY
jgi:hypothetical protein